MKQKFLIFSSVVLLGAIITTTPSYPETLARQSAFVWRGDGRGDYLLPELKESEIYASEPVIQTQGAVSSITAVWKFEGSVTLEVSADGGLHYTPVICGVSLKDGLTAGNALKWRATIGEDSRLDEVKLVYADTSGVWGDFGTPELSGFKCRKSFFVKGAGENTLFNYQVKIRLGESRESQGADLHCGGWPKPDFSDIQFTLADGETVLPYYLENITGPALKRTAEFFVKVPQIPLQGIPLYVYYGQAKAQSLSNPETTFDFYDDFSGIALDFKKWTARLDSMSNLEMTPQGLLLDAATVYSKNYKFGGGIIEYSATAETGYEARLIIRDPNPDSETDISQVAYSSGFAGAQHCIAVGDIVKVNAARRPLAVTRYDYRVTVDAAEGGRGDNITFERYAPGFSEKEAVVTYQDADGPKKGFIGLQTKGEGRGKSISIFHWIRARKHSRFEPVIKENSAGREEFVTMPIFANTTIDANGDVILAKGVVEGVYVNQENESAFDISILTPFVRGAGISFDVSADSGKNYKKDCRNNIYYYTSRKEFIKGNNLKYGVRLVRNKNTPAPRLESLALQYATGTITLLAPNGGEALKVGTQAEIRWTAWDYEKIYPMRLEVSLDGGKTYFLIADRVENDGVYLWDIPNKEEMVTDKALIRISDAEDAATYDMSDGLLAIQRDKK